MNKSHIFTILTITLLLTTSFALYFLKDSTLSEVRMTLFGEGVKEVDYGETAEYTIYVENVGEGSKHVHLQITGVPEHWHASLDKRDLLLSGDSTDTVVLTVSAPSEERAGSRGLTTVAEIGVRGGNVTIGTITILRGTATILRNGQSSPLTNNSEILSGDIVITQGSALISLDVTKLFSNIGNATGEIYILLHDATVGFLRHEDRAFMWVLSGTVLIKTPEIANVESRGAASRTPVVNLSESTLIDENFPGREYGVVLEFDSHLAESFFCLKTTVERTKVEVYGGEVVVRNEQSNLLLKKYRETTTGKEQTIPEPQALERSIIVLDSDGSVEGAVYGEGKPLLERDDVFHFRIESKEYYVSPILSEITLNIEDPIEGKYRVSFTTLEGLTNKTFSVRTTSSVETTDRFVYSRDLLKLKNMELGKTYDLIISYENVSSGVTRRFEFFNIKTIAGDQEFRVLNWEKLGDEGYKAMEISPPIEEKDDEDEKDIPWLSIAIWGVIIALTIIGVAVVFCYMPTPTIGRRGLIVEEFTTAPESPNVNEETKLSAVLLNDGETIKVDEHEILVSFFEKYRPLSEKPLSKDLESDARIELPVVKWTPKKSGERQLTVLVEVDGKEADTNTVAVVVGEKEKEEGKQGHYSKK